MAGLILKKIRQTLSPPDEASQDLQCLHSFYSSSDDLVQEHFGAELRDDLRALLGHGGCPDEDWGW